MYQRTFRGSRSRCRSRSLDMAREDRNSKKLRYRRDDVYNDSYSRSKNVVGPRPCNVLGVFGLSIYTTEEKLRDIFSEFGPIDKINIVLDSQTGQSRGFCFIYYSSLEDAKAAKNHCEQLEVDGRKIRVDFSNTQRPHGPTPGQYIGKRTDSSHEKYRSHHRRSSERRSRSSSRNGRTKSRSRSRGLRHSPNRSRPFSPTPRDKLEAEVEEEILPKGTESRSKQDVMKLRRDQISMLDKKLQELRNDLKKVLNEDGRKRQMHEKMFTIQNPQQQMFVPQRGVPPHSYSNSQASVAKRTRIPSPPHQKQKHNYLQQNFSEIEAGRRGGKFARSVLWNKQPQYHTPGTLFVTSSNPPNTLDSRTQPIIYQNYQGSINLPIDYNVNIPQQPSLQSKQEIEYKHPQPPKGTVDHINLNQSGMPTQQNQGPLPQQMKQGQPITIEKIQQRPPYYLEFKHDARKDLRSVQQLSLPSHTYTTALRAGHIPINPAMAAATTATAANQHIPKRGNITQGYPPVRPSNQQ